MLNWRVVAKALASFTGISYVLCVAAGLLIPTSLHASWLLEALLPAFKWLSFGSFVLGLVEASVYGACAGFLYSTLYNYFARCAGVKAESAVVTARAS